MPLYLFFILFSALLAGCAAPASRWRNSALNNFNSALAAGSQQSAPLETDQIRLTLALADRYFAGELHDDAERLYELSSRNSRLLYSNLMLTRVRHGAALSTQDAMTQPPEETSFASDPVASGGVLRQSDLICSAAPEVESIPQPVLPAYRVPRESPCIDAAVSPETPDNAGESGIISAMLPIPVPLAANRRNTPPGSRPARVKGGDRRAGSGHKTIYLTFDDGPSRLTLPIAAYLSSQGIGATFFALGSNIKGHEKVVRDTIALGHRVGNHTLSHDLRKLNGSLRQGVNEIETTAAMIEKLGGDGKMVRIPYGASSAMLASAVASEGGQIFDWDIDSHDSSRRGARDHAFIEHTVLQQLQSSDKRHIIMLFHDGGGHDATLAAIRNLVPRLKQEGYRFGLLSHGDRVAQSGRERNPSP